MVLTPRPRSFGSAQDMLPQAGEGENGAETDRLASKGCVREELLFPVPPSPPGRPERGFGLLAARGRLRRLERLGNRIVAEFRQRGYTVESQKLADYLESLARICDGATFGRAAQACAATNPLLGLRSARPSRRGGMARRRYGGVRILRKPLASGVIMARQYGDDFRLPAIWWIKHGDNRSVYFMLSFTPSLSGADPSGDGYSEIQVTDETLLKCAAVLVPLVEAEDGWHILYTRRTDRVWKATKDKSPFRAGAATMARLLLSKRRSTRPRKRSASTPPGPVLGRLPNMITITAFRVRRLSAYPLANRVPARERTRWSGVFTIPLCWLADRRNRSGISGFRDRNGCHHCLSPLRW